MSSTRGLLSFRRMLLVGVGLISSICWAHNGEGIPQPQVVPEQVEEIRPPRWSWLHWWEANRDPYLSPSNESMSGQPPEKKVPDDLAKAATETLKTAAHSRSPQTRACALIALARMGAPGAAQALSNAVGDSDAGVRRAAVMGLGLLGTPEAESILRDDARFGGKMTAERNAALGMMDQYSQESTDRLRRAARSRNADAASIATAGLKRHIDPATRRQLEEMLFKTDSCWLASDAILALGNSRSPDVIGLLADILLGRGSARGIAIFRQLENAQAVKNQIFQAKARNDFQRSRQQTNPQMQPDAMQVVPGKVVSGIEWTYASELRAAAAIALGMIDHPRARQALREALKLPNDYYSDLYKGPALISLGRIGDAQSLTLITSILNAKLNQAQKDSPLRGYAAVALGLYARLIEENGKTRSKPNALEAIDTLAEHLLDRNEMPEVRVASALALGLSRRKEALDHLRQIEQDPRPGEETIYGFSLLARGMLKDPTMIEPAKKFLSVIKARSDMAGILGQRAAILGLGLLDDEATLPILQDAWNMNYYASREVIAALALSSSPKGAEIVLKLLEETKDEAEKAYLAKCVGEMLAKKKPSAISKFLNDSNYMMKNGNLLPFQSMANEFLLNYLIGAFGDQWR